MRITNKYLDALKLMSSAELEAEADKFLYGGKRPKNKNGIEYLLPKKIEINAKCAGCGKPIARGGAGKCRQCYRAKSQIRNNESICQPIVERLQNVGWESDGLVPIHLDEAVDYHTKEMISEALEEAARKKTQTKSEWINERLAEARKN